MEPFTQHRSVEIIISIIRNLGTRMPLCSVDTTLGKADVAFAVLLTWQLLGQLYN